MHQNGRYYDAERPEGVGQHVEEHALHDVRVAADGVHFYVDLVVVRVLVVVRMIVGMVVRSAVRVPVASAAVRMTVLERVNTY